MVAVPGVKNDFPLSIRYWSNLVKRWRRMVCFKCWVYIMGLKINSTMWFSIFLGTNNHSMTPCDRLPNCNMLKYVKSDVLTRPALTYSFQWIGTGTVVISNRFSIWIHHQSHWWSIHQWQWLVIICIEGIRFVIVCDKLFYFCKVTFRSWIW